MLSLTTKQIEELLPRCLGPTGLNIIQGPRKDHVYFTYMQSEFRVSTSLEVDEVVSPERTLEWNLHCVLLARLLSVRAVSVFGFQAIAGVHADPD